MKSLTIFHDVMYSDIVTWLSIKEDCAEVTLGILMVSGQQLEYINLPRPSHPQDLDIGQDLK